MRWFLLVCLLLGGCSTDDEWNNNGQQGVNLLPRNHEQP